jgi:hypothetical protein
MKEAMVVLAGLIGETLAQAIAPDTRFALVVWCDDEPDPMFSTSNEYRLEIVREMLKASAGMISEIELYADHEAGHA